MPDLPPRLSPPSWESHSESSASRGGNRPNRQQFYNDYVRSQEARQEVRQTGEDLLRRITELSLRQGGPSPEVQRWLEAESQGGRGAQEAGGTRDAGGSQARPSTRTQSGRGEPAWNAQASTSSSSRMAELDAYRPSRDSHTPYEVMYMRRNVPRYVANAERQPIASRGFYHPPLPTRESRRWGGGQSEL